MPSRTRKGSGPMCLAPENIMCSKRWAKPLLPGVWLAAPTWYQTSTATSGSRWSSLRMTVRPLGSWYFSNWIWGSAVGASAAREIRAGVMAADSCPLNPAGQRLCLLPGLGLENPLSGAGSRAGFEIAHDLHARPHRPRHRLPGPVRRHLDPTGQGRQHGRRLRHRRQPDRLRRLRRRQLPHQDHLGLRGNLLLDVAESWPTSRASTAR